MLQFKRMLHFKPLFMPCSHLSQACSSNLPILVCIFVSRHKVFFTGFKITGMQKKAFVLALTDIFAIVHHFDRHKSLLKDI